MNETVEEFLEEYTETVQSCERFTFLPRGIEYQKEAIKDLTELLEKSGQIRIEVIKQDDEEAANQILVLRCMINALRYELKMWIDLKEEAWEKAWGVNSPLFPTGCFSRTGHKRYPLESGASGERVATAGPGPTETQPHMPDQIQPAERATCCGLGGGGR